MATKSELERQRASRIKELPDLTQVLRGSVFERVRRCGVPSCHCSDGPGHPVVCVGTTLQGGKNVQVTIPPDLLPLVREWTDNYKRLLELVEDVSAINRQLLRERLIDKTSRTGKRRSRG